MNDYVKGLTPDQLPSLSIIIPARNEAGTIKKIVDELPDLGFQTEIIFIENRSRDNTLEELERVVAEYSGPKKIRFTSIDCEGKVEAVMKGFEMAQGDICIIYDADMTVPPDEVVQFYEALKEGRGKLMNGSRFVHGMEKNAMRSLNNMGNRFYTFALSRIVDERLTDTLCGTKALWRDDYEMIKGTHALYRGLDPFGDFDLLIGAWMFGLKIIEIPVNYKARIYGATNIKRLRHGWRLIKMLILTFMYRKRRI